MSDCICVQCVCVCVYCTSVCLCTCKWGASTGVCEISGMNQREGVCVCGGGGGGEGGVSSKWPGGAQDLLLPGPGLELYRMNCSPPPDLSSWETANGTARGSGKGLLTRHTNTTNAK